MAASEESWTIGRLVEYELSRPVNGAACGGSHRLMGLSYAVQKRKQREQPVDGQWARAALHVEQYQQYSFKLQKLKRFPLRYTIDIHIYFFCCCFFYECFQEKQAGRNEKPDRDTALGSQTSNFEMLGEKFKQIFHKRGSH